MRRSLTVLLAATLSLALLTDVAAASATHPDRSRGAIQGFVSTSEPPTTADCEALFDVACYEPGQIQQAYGTPTLYSQGVTGKGETIIIVDSFGCPTIQADLATFDQTFGLPAPPSFKIYQPAGAVPPFDPTNDDMLGWAGETTLDVEYAHTIAPGANIVLLETPVSETEGTTGFRQVVPTEEWALDPHLGGVISQSFSATEQTFATKSSLFALRGAYEDALSDGVTVLSASGDSGAANVENDEETYYTFPTTNWPPSDPLATGIGGTQLHLDSHGNH